MSVGDTLSVPVGHMPTGSAPPYPSATGMPTPREIVGRIEAWGAAKTRLTLTRLLGLGVMAGVFIAIGGACLTLVVTSSDLGFGPTRLLGGIVFSLGLMLVVLTGAELSTGNCLLVVPWLTRGLPTSALLRNWGLSFTANTAGALLFALLAASSGVFDGDALQHSVRRIAEAKLQLPAGQAFVRGILCNMLVCLAVWMSFAASTAPGKMLAVLLPITAFVALGFEHSVANLYLLPLGFWAGAGGGAAGFAGNIVPVTLGNIVGGGAVAMMLALMHGRTAAATLRDEPLPVAAGQPKFRARALVAAALAGSAVALVWKSDAKTAPVSQQADTAMPAAERLVFARASSLRARLQLYEGQADTTERLLRDLQVRLADLAQTTGAAKPTPVDAPLADRPAASQPAPPPPMDRLSCRAAAQQMSAAVVLRFAPYQKDLDAGNSARLAQIANWAEACPALQFTVRSLTDNRGSQTANLALSRRRAQLVLAALFNEGAGLALAQRRIKLEALGATAPVASNDTEDGRKQNRRVEIVARLVE
jgi:formate transporter